MLTLNAWAFSISEPCEAFAVAGASKRREIAFLLKALFLLSIPPAVRISPVNWKGGNAVANLAAPHLTQEEIASLIQKKGDWILVACMPEKVMLLARPPEMK